MVTSARDMVRHYSKLNEASKNLWPCFVQPFAPQLIFNPIDKENLYEFPSLGHTHTF
jgi:hypothetical protein